MRDLPIVITEPDARVLRGLLSTRNATDHDQEHWLDLSAELDRALVLDSNLVPAHVVTMRKRIRVLDVTRGTRQEITLVGPADADVAARKISVLAPLGIALLGNSEGDEVEWEMPGGVRRLRVERVFPVEDEPTPKREMH
jgi:regulator of nucleoside diphosphate kinase